MGPPAIIVLAWSCLFGIWKLEIKIKTKFPGTTIKNKKKGGGGTQTGPDLAVVGSWFRGIHPLSLAHVSKYLAQKRKERRYSGDYIFGTSCSPHAATMSTVSMQRIFLISTSIQRHVVTGMNEMGKHSLAPVESILLLALPPPISVGRCSCMPDIYHEKWINVCSLRKSPCNETLDMNGGWAGKTFYMPR